MRPRIQPTFDIIYPAELAINKIRRSRRRKKKKMKSKTGNFNDQGLKRGKNKAEESKAMPWRHHINVILPFAFVQSHHLAITIFVFSHLVLNVCVVAFCPLFDHELHRQICLLNK